MPAVTLHQQNLHHKELLGGICKAICEYISCDLILYVVYLKICIFINICQKLKLATLTLHPVMVTSPPAPPRFLRGFP